MTDIRHRRRAGNLTSSDFDSLKVGEVALDVANGKLYFVESDEDQAGDDKDDKGNKIWQFDSDSSISVLFSFAGFTTTQSSTQLIGGDGKWEDGSDLTFTATFNNGPPTANPTVAWTLRPEQGSDDDQDDWASSITLTDGDDNGSYIGSGTDSTHDVDYPDAGEYFIWSCTAAKGSESDSRTVSVYFENDSYYGGSDQTSWSDADIKGVDHFEVKQSLRTSRAQTLTFNPGLTEYCVYAYPKRLGALTKITDLGSGAEVSWVQSTQSNFTNEGANGGYDEDYYIYRSPQVNLGSGVQFKFE